MRGASPTWSVGRSVTRQALAHNTRPTGGANSFNQSVHDGGGGTCDYLVGGVTVPIVIHHILFDLLRPMTARTALVTGVTAGFGLAIARQLHGLGWRVIGTGRRQERLVSLGQELGDGFDWLCFDVQDRQACVDAVEELKRRHGVPDLLVNNAGLARGLEPAYQCDLDDWEQMVETNIKGLITLTRLISPDMVARKAGTTSTSPPSPPTTRIQAPTSTARQSLRESVQPESSSRPPR